MSIKYSLYSIYFIMCINIVDIIYNVMLFK